MPEAGLAEMVSVGTSDPTDVRPERDNVLMGRLIRRAQTGDLDAFSELYRLHYRMILGNHIRAVENQADADDLTSLTFLTMFSKLASSFTLSPDRRWHGLNFRRWLLAIALNLRRTYWKQGKSLPRMPGGGEGKSRREWHRLSDVDRVRKTATCSLCGENTPVRYLHHRDNFACRNTPTGMTGAMRRKRARARARTMPKPFLPAGNGRSVVTNPVSPDWVLKYVVDAVSDFNGAPDGSPVWAALDRAVKARFVCR